MTALLKLDIINKTITRINSWEARCKNFFGLPLQIFVFRRVEGKHLYGQRATIGT